MPRANEGEPSLRILEFLQDLQKSDLLGLYLKHMESLVSFLAVHNTEPQVHTLMPSLHDFTIIQMKIGDFSAETPQEPQTDREVHIKFLCAIITNKLVAEYLEHFQHLATIAGLNLQPMNQAAASGLKYVDRYRKA